MNTRRSSRLRKRSMTRRSPAPAFRSLARGSAGRFSHSTTSGGKGNRNNSRKVRACPIESMANPVKSGPMEPETENPSASQLKFSARSSGRPSAPTTWFAATWNTMKPVPISVLAA